VSGSPRQPASGRNRQLHPARASVSKAEQSKGSLLINQLHPGLVPQLGPLHSALWSHLLPESIPPLQLRSSPGSPDSDPSLIPSYPHPVCCRAEPCFPPQETRAALCQCLLRVTLLGCQAEGKRLLENLHILDGDTKRTCQQIRCDPSEVSTSNS